MGLIESSLCHLRLSVGGFVVPSAAMRDVDALKAQIELRRRALREIEIIRCRLRPLCVARKKCCAAGSTARTSADHVL
jgi:hypothetical protein